MNGRRARPLYKDLSLQILVAMLLGALVGYLWPQSADSLRPLGDLFIRLVRMIVAPIIFCTVVHGIASVGEAKRVGRVAVKALIYFEIVTTIALVLGLVVVNLWAPGVGMNVDPATLADTDAPRSSRTRGRSATASSSSASSRRAPSAPSRRATSCRCCSSR